MTTTRLLPSAEMKAATTATGTRTLDFYAAAFGVLDANGDIIDADAANAWLQDFYAEGKAMPISFAHSAMRDMTDPGRFIGDAPADPSHVWLDNYGVRMKAVLYTDMDGPMGENARAAAKLIDQNVVSGASITYLAEKAITGKDGVRHITQLSIYEAGPCLIPANPDAVILGIKTADGQLLLAEKPASEASVDATLALIVAADTVETIETETKDTSSWDSNKAMSACSTAAQYSEICAAVHTIGTADERQHYAGPHHYLGKDANETGVRAALSRWGTTYADTQLQNCTEAEWKKGLTHLQDHMQQINPNYEPATKSLTDIVNEVLETKHQSSPRYIQAAHDALAKAGAKCAEVQAEEASAEPETEPDVNAEVLHRLALMKAKLVMF